jgi:hypothetical protein
MIPVCWQACNKWRSIRGLECCISYYFKDIKSGNKTPASPAQGLCPAELRLSVSLSFLLHDHPFVTRVAASTDHASKLSRAPAPTQHTVTVCNLTLRCLRTNMATYNVNRKAYFGESILWIFSGWLVVPMLLSSWTFLLIIIIIIIIIWGTL